MAGPPFNIDDTSPNANDIISAYPANERANRALIEEWLSFISDPTTGLIRPTAVPSEVVASKIIYETNTPFTFSAASPHVITGLETGFSSFDIQMNVSGLSNNSDLRTALLGVGDGVSMFNFGSTTYGFIGRWINGSTSPRLIFATVYGIKDANYPVWMRSMSDGSIPADATHDWLTLTEMPIRPVTAIRLSMAAGGTTVATCTNLQIRAYR